METREQNLKIICKNLKTICKTQYFGGSQGSQDPLLCTGLFHPELDISLYYLFTAESSGRIPKYTAGSFGVYFGIQPEV